MGPGLTDSVIGAETPRRSCCDLSKQWLLCQVSPPSRFPWKDAPAACIEPPVLFPRRLSPVLLRPRFCCSLVPVEIFEISSFFFRFSFFSHLYRFCLCFRALNNPRGPVCSFLFFCLLKISLFLVERRICAVTTNLLASLFGFEKSEKRCGVMPMSESDTRIAETSDGWWGGGNVFCFRCVG